MRHTLIALLFAIASSSMAQGLFTYAADGSCRLHVNMQFRGNDVSSLCFIQDNGDQIVGSIVNEFGVKAFDFTYSPTKRKAKVVNVMKLLNRRMLRKALNHDFAFILAPEITPNTRSCQRERFDDGTVQMINSKYKLTYTFIPLPKEDETDQ